MCRRHMRSPEMSPGYGLAKEGIRLSSLAAVLSKLRSLGLDGEAYGALPKEKRVDYWRLNSHKFDVLYAQRRSGVTVVDLGCGPPYTQALVRDEAGADNYLGIDFDFNNRPGLVADTARLPFADKTLGLVRCFSLFEHTYDYRQSIDDIYRALRPGGSLFIQTPFLLAFHGYPSDYFRFTHVGWRHILEDAGFKVIDWDIEYGRGFFTSITKTFEDGSFSFHGAHWFWLRFVLRGLSRTCWRLRGLDKYYSGSMYASVLILGERPGKDKPATSIQSVFGDDSLQEPLRKTEECAIHHNEAVAGTIWGRVAKALGILFFQGPAALFREIKSYVRWKASR